METVLTKNFNVPNAHTIDVYEKTGGYDALKKALQMKPVEVLEEVKKSGLRGRGGAGFPAGMKWGFVPQNTGKPIYLCVNADESEPGTFKDRALLELDPHRVIEGAMIAAHAINCRTAYIYIRGEFDLSYRRLQTALSESYAKKYLGETLNIYIHRGAGAYICGEETALLESIEGKRGYPRIKPPFPAIAGLFGCPTVVNNVETIAALPYILAQGAEAYKKMGTEKSPGTKLFSVSGPVKKPGVYEVPLGYPMRKFIYEDVGGMLPGKTLKAVVPGGSSMPILTAQEVEDVNLDYESIQAKGSLLGSGGMIVIDEDTCIVWALENLARFYAHESCGQCTPCREGTGWSYKILKRMVAGDSRPGDIELLLDIGKKMTGTTICVLADSLAMPIASYIGKFRGEFEAHQAGHCPRCKI